MWSVFVYFFNVSINTVTRTYTIEFLTSQTVS